MELVDVTKLQKGEKVKISGKAVEKLGWQEGELIAQYLVREKKMAVVILRRAKDVLGGEEWIGSRGG